ncbi:MAG: hypothetical protein IPJ11_16735 [Gemmatimonadetes bacterium]|nr:hypothetical protein [Gemmatimonadota bacterium]
MSQLPKVTAGNAEGHRRSEINALNVSKVPSQGNPRRQETMQTIANKHLTLAFGERDIGGPKQLGKGNARVPLHHGLSISGIGLFLTETSMFKNHVEARLRRFGIVESATDPSVLANYSQRTIQRIELAAQTALLPSAGLPREIGDLLHSLPEAARGFNCLANGVPLRHRTGGTPVECGMYQLKKSFELTFVNNSGRTTTHTQTIKLGKLGAHPKSDGKHKSEVTKLEIGGVDCLATAERADTEEMLVRNVTFDIPPESTPADRIRMRVEETTCYPTGMPWVLSMNTPTQGFRTLLSLQVQAQS